MINNFRKLGTVMFALALSTASLALAGTVGGGQYSVSNNIVQVSTSPNPVYVNSIQVRPLPGQQCPIEVYYGGTGTSNLLAVINPYPTAGEGASDSYPVADPRPGDSINITQFFVGSTCSWETTTVFVSWYQTGTTISQITPYIRGLIVPFGSSGWQLCQSCKLAMFMQFRQYRWNVGKMHVQEYTYPAATLAVLAAWANGSPSTDRYEIKAPLYDSGINPALLAVSSETPGDGIIVVAWG